MRLMRPILFRWEDHKSTNRYFQRSQKNSPAGCGHAAPGYKFPPGNMILPKSRQMNTNHSFLIGGCLLLRFAPAPRQVAITGW